VDCSEVGTFLSALASPPACSTASVTAAIRPMLESVAPDMVSTPRLWYFTISSGSVSSAPVATVGVSDWETTSMDSMAVSLNVTSTVMSPPLPEPTPVYVPAL